MDAEIGGAGFGGRENFTRFYEDKAIVLRPISTKVKKVAGVWVKGYSEGDERWFFIIRPPLPISSKIIIVQDGVKQPLSELKSKQRFRGLFWNYDTAKLEIVEKGLDFFGTRGGLGKWQQDPAYGDVTKFDFRCRIENAGYGPTVTPVPLPSSKPELPADVRAQIDATITDIAAELEWPTMSVDEICTLLGAEYLDSRPTAAAPAPAAAPEPASEEEPEESTGPSTSWDF